MTLFERLRNSGSGDSATANPAKAAISEPPLAGNSSFSSSSRHTNQSQRGPLTVSHCRVCNHPAGDDFLHMCPSCGTTHPFAATDEISMAPWTAEHAIAQASLTDEQKASRLADLRRKPEIAKFWARLFDSAEG